MSGGGIRLEGICLDGHLADTWDLVDARGIYCCKVCSRCVRIKERTYRPEIFTNPNYVHDEPIEEDAW